jgi:glycosyltransferase involved in cell wall biosynthesis
LSKKRLTILAYPMETAFGGPPRVVDRMTTELGKYFDVTIVTFGYVSAGYFKEKTNDIKFINQRSLTRSVHRPVLRIKKEIRTLLRQSDLILVHGVYFSYVFLISFLIGIKAKKIFMPHGVLEPYQQKIRRYRKSLFDGILNINKFWSNSTFIVATNSEVLGVRQKFPSSNIYVVGLPVTVPLELIPKEPKKLNNENRIELVHVGRIAEKKRIDLTLHAVAELKKLGITSRFTIVGKGEYTLEQRLINLTKTLDIEDEVTFKGQLDGTNLYKEYVKADIMVLPSENENFALSVAESVLLKTPCIVSSEVALKEVVIEHKTGIVLKDLGVTDLVNAILQIYEKYDFYSTNAFNVQNLFSTELVGKDWLEVLMKEFE